LGNVLDSSSESSKAVMDQVVRSSQGLNYKRETVIGKILSI